MTESWYLAEVHPNREAAVAFTMRCLDIEPFVPLILQTERISARTRRKELNSRPLIAGYVFFRTDVSRVDDANAIKDVRGLSVHEGEYITIPDRKMVQFIMAHDQWIADARASYRRGRLIKNTAPKAKFQKMTPELLKRFMETYYGDTMQEAA